MLHLAYLSPYPKRQRGSAVFAQLTAGSPYVLYSGPALPLPLTTALSHGGLDAHSKRMDP